MLLPVMMATLLPGSSIRRTQSLHSEKMELRTRRHGEQSTCVVHQGLKSTTWHGLQMGYTSLLEAWTTSPESTMPRAVCFKQPNGIIHIDKPRTTDSTSRRTSALCARSSMGPFERVHCNTVLRSIRPYLHLEDERGHICLR